MNYYNQDQYKSYGTNASLGNRSNQCQKSAPVSTLKEKQLMVNEMLGKLFAHIEVLLYRGGWPKESIYWKYLGEGTAESTTTNLMRNMKMLITGLYANISDNEELLGKALSGKETPKLIENWLHKSSNLSCDDPSMKTASKLLNKLLGDLTQGKIELVDHALSNEIRNIKQRDQAADEFIRNNQEDAIKVIHRSQQAVNHMTKQMEKISDEDVEFTPQPKINLNPKLIKDTHHWSE